MLTKNQVKLIQSLRDKKSRQQQGLFVAEGVKACVDLMGSNLMVKTVYASKEWFTRYGSQLSADTETIEVTRDELQKVSRHQAPQDVLMLIAIPERDILHLNPAGITLLLETIQDPGNLGTIIRTADWFGIGNIVCSMDCADVYNPKVIDSSMGSIGRVPVFYSSLEDFIDSHSRLPVYGAMLNGKNIYTEKLAGEALLIIGNEGQGISATLQSKVTRPVMIPRMGKAESLNAAVATAILCDHFARQNFI